MAPVRKRKIVTKEGAEQNEQNVPRKRKLSEMLGSQWSKKELENFYKAYRKYGMDWKKVASAVHGRTVEMVAALYNMNRAYLSLPDQIGSPAGFIAMMIDHYNMLDMSNSDEDSAEDSARSKSPKQKAQLKNKLSNTNNFDGFTSGLMHTRLVPVFGCLPPGKKRTGGRRSRVVGKRMPRFHFSYIVEKKYQTEPFCKEELGAGVNGDFNDIEFTKSADLTLAETSLRPTAPQISGTPNRRTHYIKYPSVQNASLKGISAGTESGGSGCNDSASARVDCTLKAIEGSKEVFKKVLSSSRRSAPQGKIGRQSIDSVKGKIKKTHIKLRLECTDRAPADYAIEKHTQTGEVIGAKAGNDKLIDIEAVDKMGKKPNSRQPKKRSRKLFSGAQNSGLNVLEKLSLSGSLSASTIAPDSQLQFHEDTTENAFEGNAKASAQGFIDAIIHIKKPDILMEHERVSHCQNAVTSVDLVVTGIDHTEKVSSELNGQHTTFVAESKKWKRKMGVEKVAFRDEGQARKKLKQVTNTYESPKKSKAFKHVEACTSEGCTIDYLNQNTAVCEATLSNHYCHGQSSAMEEASLIKADRVSKYCWSISGNPYSGPDKIAAILCTDTMIEGLSVTKASLIHCLSSAKLRQWCLYEWFYSAIDLPWFERNEFVEYLNHAGLMNVPRLTCIEWGVIRSSLGKPRRLSTRFLQEEREKLDQYRKSVRKIHRDVHTGVCNVVPADLALPFSVGQQVIACHPKTREIHSGIVLTVDWNRCRVQFHRAELGVESVLDIDCMAINPMENMPETLRRKIRMWDDFCRRYGDSKLGMKSNAFWSRNGNGKATLGVKMDVPGVVSTFVDPSYSSGFLSNCAKADMADFVKQTKVSENDQLTGAQQSMYNQPSTLEQLKDRDTDCKALSCLNCALDKKEALLTELKHLNDDLSTSEKEGEILRNTVAFCKQYAYILMQLKIVNEQVISSLKSLRKRNAYRENIVPPWHCASSNSRVVEGLSTLERVVSVSIRTSPKVLEIVTNANRKARLMVDAAMQVMLSLRDDEDAIVKLGVALDTVSGLRMGLDSGKMKIKSHSSYLDSIKDVAEQESLSSHQSFGPELIAVDASQEKNELSHGKEGPLLAEIAASCVSALILIQTCSDSKFLPSEVTHLLDDAVRSLQPCSSSNLIIYSEIQRYMSIVRNQILTLMPTQPSISITTEVSSGNQSKDPILVQCEGWY